MLSAEPRRNVTLAVEDTPYVDALVDGTPDGIVPVSHTRAMPRARLRMIEEADHFHLIHPGTAAFGVMVKEIGRLVGGR